MLNDPSGFWSQPSNAGETPCPLEYDSCALATGIHRLPASSSAMPPFNTRTLMLIIVFPQKTPAVNLSPVEVTGQLYVVCGDGVSGSLFQCQMSLKGLWCSPDPKPLYHDLPRSKSFSRV